METQTTTKRPSTALLLGFIQFYRDLEKQPLKKAYSTLKTLVLESDHTKKDFNHMCDKWHNSQRDFASYFLGSLSFETVIQMLKKLGVADQEDQEFLDKCESDPHYQFLNYPTGVSFKIRLMLLFFNNNGINPNPIKGMHLQNLPEEHKRFGNSANWGDYIFTLPNPGHFFDVLYENYTG